MTDDNTDTEDNDTEGGGVSRIHPSVKFEMEDDADIVRERLADAQQMVDILVQRKLSTYADLKVARARLTKLERAARIYDIEYEERADEDTDPE